MKLNGKWWVLLIVLAGLCLMVSACSDDEDSDTDGDESNEDGDESNEDGDESNEDGDEDEYVITLKLDGQALNFKINLMMDAFYDTFADQTGVGDEKVGLYFPGNTTGTFTGADGLTFTVIDADGNEWYAAYDTSFSATVTAYGAVGETIEGEFAGTVISSDDDTTTGEVTDGWFALERSEDN